MTPPPSSTSPRSHLDDLLDYLDSSPSPYHAVEAGVARLERAGFGELAEGELWPSTGGRHYVRRGGSLIAWAAPSEIAPPFGFRIVGAHTDSPNLRLKPRPDTGSHGYRQLGVEVYGGVLTNSWLDRDLGVSGRVTIRDGSGTSDVLVHDDTAGLRVPQLAIHLDREVTTNGLVLNPQTHLRPLWGLGEPREGDFVDAIVERAGIGPVEVLGHDLMLHDLAPARLLGAGDELLSSARIDNLLSCHAGLTAMLDVPDDAATVAVLCLFDHEEIGSTSTAGAASSMLPTVLQRVVHGLGGDDDALAASLARSVCLSADGAHATHPNYPERHDPEHHIELDGGPVLKFNSNVRYATDSSSAASFVLACEVAEVPHQSFVMRSDMACGSTIGPITAARLGVSTADVGVAQLSMHSARELCGSTDPHRFAKALGAFVSSRA